MNLLAEIYSQEEMIPKSTEKQNFDLNEVVHVDDSGEGKDLQESPYMLSMLAPRLWPFMRHSITSVRHSAIRTLVKLFFLALLFFILYGIYLLHLCGKLTGFFIIYSCQVMKNRRAIKELSRAFESVCMLLFPFY